MNRKGFSLFIVIAVLMALVPTIRPAQALTANVPPNIVVGCAGVTDLGSSYTADRDNTGSNSEAYIFRGTDGYGNVFHLFANSVPVGFIGPIGNFTWQTPPQANPLTLEFISLAGNSLPEQIVLSVTGICPGLPYAEEPEPEPVPGCDVLIPIPATAVGGSFVADAPVYWEPGQLTQPLVTIPAGKSALVVGQDSSNAYYKVLWVCDFVWVPKGTMGPNFDAVWNGAALPTAVVN